MAASFTRVAETDQRRDLGYVLTDMACDTAYPSPGGYPVTPANLGLLDAPDHVECYVKSMHRLIPVYDQATSKVQLWQAGTANAPLNECTSSDTDVTASVIVRIKAHGRPAM